MRRILAGLALALLIASPVYAVAGASITAPDGLVFGQSFSVAYTPANGRDRSYWALGECFQGGTIVYRQYVDLEPLASFTLGPTPAWSGGAADCTVTLLSVIARGTNAGNFSDALATDDFIVAP